LLAISSPGNPLVKTLSKLQQARHRREQGLFLVEGSRAIGAFLAAGWRPAHLLVRSDEPVPADWPEAQRVSAAVIERISAAVTPPGYVAAFPIPTPPALEPARGGLALAEVMDPGNAGTLLRTAAALGVQQVALIGGVDPYAPKVVQASAGALALLRVHELPASDGLTPFADAPLCALVARGGEPPDHFRRGARWLVVGGEAHGIRDEWLARCAERLTLPMPGGTESLNAAVAGAIALYLLAMTEAP
jgi:RNA methyltransferase, TrmH family